MTEITIPKDVVYWEDAVSDELSSEEAASFHEKVLEATKIRRDFSGIYARMVLWQCEDKKYGLKNIQAVKNDKELSDFCERVVGLYRREAVGETVASKEFQDLYTEIAKARDVAGERERVRGIKVARKWAWVGGRKWAWITRRGWRNTWAWIIMATRNRNMTQAVTLTATWDSAFKWSRFWENRQARMMALENYFIKIIEK